MERFELVKSEEEREKDYERIVNFFRQHGIKEDWKISSLISEKESDFGLNNLFPKLSEKEEIKRDKLFKQRELLISKYKRLAEQLEPLIVLERNMWEELVKLNESICEVEGHRLSEESTREYDIDDYGHHVGIGYYRTCLICGKKIYKAGLKENDVVVKGEQGPKRILYRK